MISRKGHIPREQIKAVANVMIAAITPFCTKIEICGSYRRGKAICGDLDLLASGHIKCIDAFCNVCDEILTCGNSKACGVKNEVQVELRLVKEECWGSALMHTTGPVELNIRQRGLAKRNGMMSNEYGLWKAGNRIASRTEEEIYQILGMKWLNPEERR